MIRLYAAFLPLPGPCLRMPSGSVLPKRNLVFGLVAVLCFTQAAPLQAQNSIQSRTPAVNALNGSRNDAISVTFAQPVTGTTPTEAVHIFGTQTDLRTGGVYQGNNTSAFSFNPAAALHPGEQVWVTVAAPGGAGYSPYAYQYTAATGRANAIFDTPPVQLAEDIGTRSIVTADVNGDGKLDLVTLNTDGISVILANSAESSGFGIPTPISLDDTPESIAIADINNDGKLDLLVGTTRTPTDATEIKSIVISINSGNMAAPFAIDNSTPRVGVSATLSLLAADLDRNGQLDLVSINTSTSQISVRLNTNGTAQPTDAYDITLSTSPTSIIAADVNNNGAIDLVTVNNDGTLSVLYNDPQEGFRSGTVSSIPIPGFATQVTAADVDEDGDLDLITSNLLDNTVTILHNSNGSFPQNKYLQIPVANDADGDGSTDVKAADVDGDGDLDLLSSNFSGSVTILRNAGHGSFPTDYNADGATQVVITTVPTNQARLSTADLNGDAALDVIIINSDNTIYGMLNTVSSLPVSLVRFAASVKGAGVLLNWETATEIQNKGFEVQVSSSGNAFKPLAFIPSAAQNSTTHLSYSFLDETREGSGIRYYRLRQVDLNGKQTFSQVLAVRQQPVRPSISAFPNPFSQQLHVRLTGLPTAPVRLVLRNALGQQVLSQRYSALGAENTLTLTLPATLPAGSYLLEIETAGQMIHQRLLREQL